MASENAQPTMARMSEGLVEAVPPAAIATSSSRTRATIRRLATSVAPNQNGNDHDRRNGKAETQQQPAPRNRRTQGSGSQLQRTQ